MNSLPVDRIWEAFDRVDVAGRSKAVCKLCQHQLVANRGAMHMHYRMKHCKTMNGPTRPDYPLATKPLSDEHANATKHTTRPDYPTTSKPLSDEHVNATKYIDPIVLDSSVLEHLRENVSKANDRERDRTFHMLRYLASEPSDEAYAAIIAVANGHIIRTIAEVGRAYMRDDLEDLSQAESLVLARHRESIDKFAYALTTRDMRNALLEPHANSDGSVPESAEYVPMLLALAVARGELETHIDHADASIAGDDEPDGSSDSEGSSDGRHGDDSEDASDSRDASDSEASSDGRHGDDSEDASDSRDASDSEASSDGHHADDSVHSEESSDDNEMSSDGRHGNANSGDSEGSSDDETDDSEGEKDMHATQQETEDSGHEADNEEDGEYSESSDQDSQKTESEESDETEEESEDDDSESDDDDDDRDSDELESEESEGDAESEDTEASEDDHHSTQTLKRSHNDTQSYLDMWKRQRLGY
jgi:hypothetical protein